MALYRNIAGAEALGIIQDAYYIQNDAVQSEGGGGGFAIAPGGPLLSVDPAQPVAPPVVDYWYAFAEQVPPTNAPAVQVEPPPPDAVLVSRTGQTIYTLSDNVPNEIAIKPGVQTVQPPAEPVQYTPITQDMNTNAPASTTTPDNTTTTGQYQVLKDNMLPLLTLLAVVGITVKGTDWLGNKRHIAFVGGLGALYYFMQKK